MQNKGRGLDPDITYEERLVASRKILGHAYTEKLLYRPGQTIHWKALFRERNADDLQLDFPQSFGNVQVKITDSKREEIFNQDMPTNQYGSVTGELLLPQGAVLGEYKITITPLLDDKQLEEEAATSTIISIEEYVLPTFKINAFSEKHDYFSTDTLEVQVSALEYSGAPLVNGTVDYRLIARPYYAEDQEDLGYFYGHDYSRFRREYRNETVFAEQVELDKNGQATLVFSLDGDQFSTEFDYSLSLEYTVSDDQNRKVNDTISFRRFRATAEQDYLPGIKFKKRTFSLNEDVTFDFVSKNFKMQRQGKREFELEFLKKVQKCEETREIFRGQVRSCEIELQIAHTTKIRTDTQGYGSYRHRVLSPGHYVVELKNGPNKVSREIWITSQNMGPAIDTHRDRYLTLALDKEAYQPGETAKLSIHSPYPRSLVLLSFEANDVIHTEVVSLQTALLEYDIAVQDKYLPNIYVNAIVVEKNPGQGLIPNFKIGYTNLTVDTAEKQLQISIDSNQEIYKPGDAVNLTVETKDANGEPVPAEVSLAVVDEAIIRLGGQVDTRLSRRFHSRRLLFVSNAFSLVGLHHDYYFATYGGSGKGGFSYSVPPVRKNFEEVAYFNGILETNENGKANIEFQIPDKLTSYIVLGAGFSRNNRHLMGSSESMIVTQQDFYIQPILPRFFRHNDEAVLIARAYNRTDSAAEVGLLLEGSGFEILDNQNEQTHSIEADHAQDFSFRVKISDTDKEAKIVFKSASAVGADAMEITKPIYSYELFSDMRGAVSMSKSFLNPESKRKIKIPKYASKEHGTIELEATNSLLLVLKSNLSRLLKYPYGCAEQTISSTVPNAVYYALQKTLDLPEDERAFEYTMAGLERLQSFQNPNGGFGWWRGDSQFSPQVSWNIGNGLVDISRAGFEIPTEMKEKYIRHIEQIIVATPNSRYDKRQKLDAYTKLNLVYILTNLELGI
jgi:uncharacterized protein YfaS (alpha-2-macroglobulin family)